MSPASAPPPTPREDAGTAWSVGPLRPRLAEGAAHLWRADLRTVDDDLSELLDAGEHARAQGISREPERTRWRRSRALLRALLGRYLDEDPSALQIVAGRYGKPELAGERPEQPRLHFNLSHSRGLAVYAFSDVQAVGVDVQFPREAWARGDADYVALARRAFGAASAQRLVGLERASQERELLRAWTRHEAELKRLGRGLRGGLRPPAGGERGWSVNIEVDEHAAGALALAREARELRRYSWT